MRVALALWVLALTGMAVGAWLLCNMDHSVYTLGPA